MTGSDPAVELIDRYTAAAYEAGGEPSLMPWNDPDGGQLRIIATLRAVLIETDHPDVRRIVEERFAAPGANDNLPPPED